MSIELTVLLQAKYVENAQTTQFTVPSAVDAVIIDRATATNAAVGAATLTVNVVQSGGSASNSNMIVDAKSIAAGDCYLLPELVGQVMTPGDFLSAISDTASAIVLRVSGRIVR